jgi:hypothetical protein
MNRRSFLRLLAAVPFVRLLKGKPAPMATGVDLSSEPDQVRFFVLASPRENFIHWTNPDDGWNEIDAIHDKALELVGLKHPIHGLRSGRRVLLDECQDVPAGSVLI